MKSQKRGSVGKTLEEMRRFFYKIGNLWFFILAFMLDLARALKNLCVLDRKTFLLSNTYNNTTEKMEKKRFGIIYLVILFLTVMILMPQILAADPGHAAGAISTGQFESGNYTFPDSLHIDKFLNVTGVLYVDPLTSRVGIGTTSPGATLDVWGSVPKLTIQKTGALLYTFEEGTMSMYKANSGDVKIRSIGGRGLNIESAADTHISLTPLGSGKVGINTTAPTQTLTIEGDLNVTEGLNLSMYVSCTALETDASGNLLCGSDADTGATLGVDQWGWTNTTGLVYTTQSSDLVHIGGNVSLADNLTVGGNALYVDSSSGRVGIGTTAPAFKLDVYGDINSTGLLSNVTSCANGLITDSNGLIYCSGSAFGGSMDYTNIAMLNESVLNDTYFRLVEDGASFNATIAALNLNAYDPANIAFLNESELNASYVRFGTFTNAKWCVATGTNGVVDCNVEPVSDTTGNDLAYGPDNIAFLNETILNSTYFRLVDDGAIFNATFALNASLDQYQSRTSWAEHDSYPDACAAGQYVSQVGDTLTCSAPSTGNDVAYDPANLAFLNESELNASYVRFGTFTNAKWCVATGTNGVVDCNVEPVIDTDTIGQWGWTNTTGLVYTTQSSDLVHIGGNVSMADNLTVGGDKFYVDSSSGRVGIGTTSPGVQTAAGRTYLTLKGSTGGGALELTSAEADAEGILIGLVQFTDGSSTSTDKRTAVIGSLTSGTTANNRGGVITFYTKADGTSEGIPERMRIDNLGYVGVNITAPTHAFSVQGTMNVTRSAGAAGGIEVTSTGDVVIRLG